MATLAKTWAFDVNNVGTTNDVVEVYQELFLALHASIKNAGWTVVFSSNAVVADANDNVSGPSDVVQATNSSTPRTWILYNPPAGSPVTSGYQLMLETEVVSAAAQSQGVRFYASQVGFDTSGAATDTLPVSTDGVALGSLDLLIDIRPWALTSNDAPAVWHALWTTEGDLLFLTKPDFDRTPYAYSVFLIRTDTSARSGAPEESLTIVGGWFGTSAVTIPAAPNAVVFSPHNNVNAVAPDLLSIAFDADWSDGLDENGFLLDFPIYWLVASDTSVNRYMGIWTDIRGVSDNLPPAIVVDGDTDPIRYTHVVRGLFTPWPASEIPPR